MREFAFSLSTRLIAGREGAVTFVRSLSGRRLGLVASASALHNTDVRNLVTECREVATVVDLGTVSPNPRFSAVDGIANAAAAARVDALLAIGGGSVMDAAKAARVALSSQKTVRALLSQSPAAREASVLLVCIPTAFGTGAETSAGAILTDDSTGEKLGLRGAAVAADVALLCAGFGASLPLPIRTLIAFDALAHAIETYLSRAASPLTDVFAEETLRTLPPVLQRLANGDASADDAETVTLCSAMMGANLANASTCLPHRMQYAVARAKDSNHQADLVALYPAWLDAVQRSGVPRLTVVAASIAASLPEPDASASAASLFRTFASGLGFRHRLSDLGLTPSDASQLTDWVTGNIGFDPIAPTRSDILQIFRESLA